MKLIVAYVSPQWSLGMRFDSADRLLRQCARATGDVCVDEIQA
ncbi:hypothetical protein [Bradyrhizobium sp. LMG 9283]